MGFTNYKSDYNCPSECVYEDIDGRYSISMEIELSEFVIDDLIIYSHEIYKSSQYDNFNTKSFLFYLSDFLSSIEEDKMKNEDGNRKYYLRVLKAQLKDTLEMLDEPKNIWLKSLFDDEQKA